MDETRLPKWKIILLTVADHLILAFILTPLIVLYWWATWSLLDYYIYPDNKLRQGGTIFFIGVNGVTICYCAQDLFTRFSQKYDSCFVWFIFNRVYTAMLGFFHICHWFSLWNLCDLLISVLVGYWGDTLTWTIMILAVATISLMLMRQLINARATPVALAVDTDPNPYKITTRFNKSWKQHGCYFILDCVFTAAIVHSLVVLFWKNSWAIWDLQMARYGIDLANDGAICLLTGYLLTLLVYLAQIPVRKFIRAVSNTKDHWIFRVLIEQLLMHLWVGQTSVAAWRGFWNLYSVYVKIPNSPVGGLWISVTSALAVLMFLLAGMSVLARGGDVDGACEDGSGAIMPTKYIRYFIEMRLTKKLQKEAALEMENLSAEKSKENVVENGEVEVGDKLLEERPDV